MHKFRWFVFNVMTFTATALLSSSFAQEMSEIELREKIDQASSTVELAEIINQHFGRDVNPEENAFAALQPVFGPSLEGNTEPDDFYRLLGIQRPSDDGTWFHVPTHNDDQERRDRWLKQERIASHGAWTSQECPEIEESLRQNERAMKLATEAVKHDRWFRPVIISKGADRKQLSLITAVLPRVRAIRDLASHFRYRAYLRLASGQINDAWNDVVTMHRLGRLMSQGPSVVDYQVGSAIDALACSLATVVLNSESITAEQLGRFESEWSSLPRLASLYDAIYITERLVLIDQARAIERGQSSAADLLELEFESEDTFSKLVEQQDWSHVYRSIHDVVQELSTVLSADLAHRSGQMTEFQARWDIDQPEAVSKKISDLLLQNEPTAEFRKQVARLTVSSMLLPYGKTEVSHRRNLQVHQNIRIQLALRRYFLDENRYPDDLQQLVPKFIDEIPMDLFGGEPLRYQSTPTEIVLYSIGPNMVDDQGKDTVPGSGDSDWPVVGDIVVRLPGKG